MLVLCHCRQKVQQQNHPQRIQQVAFVTHPSFSSVQHAARSSPRRPPGLAVIARAPPVDGSVVRSKDNTYVKHCVKLRTSKSYRDEVGTVLLVGATLIREVLAATPREAPLNIKVLFLLENEPLPGILCSEKAIDYFTQFVLHSSNRSPIDNDSPTHIVFFIPDMYAQCVLRVSEPVFTKITGLQSVEGVGAAAEVDLPREARLSAMPSGTLRRLLVLEGVQDPGNLGTLLRSALAFGWEAVYLLPGCCDPFNDKAVRASRGAAFRIPLAHGGWDELDALIKQHDMVAVAAQPHAPQASGSKVLGGRSPAIGPQDMGPSWPSWDPLVAEMEAGISSIAVCLVLGSEGQGLSEQALGHCRPVAIPMQEDVDSLNVAVAGGVLLFVFSHSMPRMLSALL